MDNEKTVKLNKDEFETLMANAVKASVGEQIKELGLDKVDRKFGNFPGSIVGMSDEDVQKMEKKEKVARFIKAVFHKDYNSLARLNTKAMSEGTGSAGGFIVPEEFAAEVNRIVEDFGLIPKLARRIPMGSDTRNIPRLASSVSVSYPGENTAGTASQPVLAQVQLLSKTLVGLTALSNELLADANVNVVDLLTELFAEAIAGEADNQGFAGSGSPFTGILNDGAVHVVTATETTFATAASPDNLRDLITKIKPWALQGAGYVMHREVWAEVQKKKASTGGDYFISAANPILAPSGAAQGFPTAIVGTLWGYPVYLSDKMPSSTAVDTKYVIFGNLRHVWWGVRQDIAMSISDQATIGSDNLFEQNMSGVRVISRHGIVVGLPSAFAVLKTGS